MASAPATARTSDSSYAWRRLAASLALSTIGGVGLWSAVVVLPTIEAEFGVSRGGASVPYTAAMIGFSIGGVLMGRLADRFGIMLPLLLSAPLLGLGFIAAAFAASYWQFVLAQALLIGMLGSAVTFGPLVADVSLWFLRWRGIAVAIVASGNYLAGAIWPSILDRTIASVGWRQSYMAIGIFCVVTMVPLALLLRRRAAIDDRIGPARAPAAPGRLPMSAGQVQGLLVIAAIACCVAMSMPQVHIIAYCGDLGYGTARGAEMLSLMLGLGVISRLGSGFIADRIGGLPTLIVGSALQCLSLVFYLPFDGLTSLYVVSALFGLSQGGIVPNYALIVREYFPAREAGTRVSLVLMSSVVGMALGGWISGEIYDLTGSYQAAFLNGIAWNLLNLAIAGWLLMTRLRARESLAR
jgi:MFS family permease